MKKYVATEKRKHISGNRGIQKNKFAFAAHLSIENRVIVSNLC
jgi:hypothetical protein